MNSEEKTHTNLLFFYAKNGIKNKTKIFKKICWHREQKVVQYKSFTAWAKNEKVHWKVNNKPFEKPIEAVVNCTT